MKLIKILFIFIITAGIINAEELGNINISELKSIKTEETVNISIQNSTLSEFIEMVAKITDKNILIDGELKGKITFISRKPIKKSSVMTLVNSILKSKGYAIIDQGEFYKVVKGSVAAAEGLDVSSSVEGDTMKTVLFPLKNTNAAVIRAKIKPLLHKNAKIISFKENNILSITATPRSLQSISKIINAIEKKGVKKSYVLKLNHASVKDVFPNAVNMSKNIFPKTIESEKVNILKDDSTNSLILVGKSENIRRMTAYIKIMDKRGELQTQKMYVIYLKNSNVEEIQKIISKLVSQMNNMSPNKPKKGVKETKAMVVADVERNALIVLANGEQVKNIKETIRRIDIPKVQVYVKAKIVEIDDNLASQIGIKYGLNGGSITTSGLFTLSGNLGASALQMSPALLGFLNANNSKTVYDSNGNPVTENDPAFKFGDVDKVFALGAQLDFLKRNGAAHILSEPSILCTNNKEATIYVGQTRSILTQAQQSTTGVSNVVNNYTREDIGLTLKVKPRLSSNNKVTLEIKTTIEDVLENESPNADRPTTTKRDVETTAIVNNGKTIILGGLIKNTGGKGTTKIPILGDIPILGELLFTHKTDLERKTNVVIYLTPYIVRRSDELEKLKTQLSELENIQIRYNKLVGKQLEERRTGKRSSKVNSYSQIAPINNNRQKSNLDLLDAGLDDF